MNSQLDTPVVLMVFNRPVLTRIVLNAVAIVKPKTLLIIADGARPSRPGEQALCNEVRAIFQEIQWPCQVISNFADTNLGCQERIVSGLTWVFSQVEEAIILEDDCLPHETFFRFSQEMLQRHRGDDRIGSIGGTNLDPLKRMTGYSYYFSRLGGIWGWATWRDAWARYDRRLDQWDAVKKAGVLNEIFTRRADAEYWTHVFDSMHAETGPSSWAYPWVYTKLINNMLSIVPSVNLVTNIGFGEESTHTRDTGSRLARLRTDSMPFPLHHPPYVVPMRTFDDVDQKIGHVPTMAAKISRKMHQKLRMMQPARS